MIKAKSLFKTNSAGAGFTIVELVVVIVVIAIMAAVVTFGLNSYLLQGRDAQRQAKAESIVASIEKYYQRNGEYPGCNLLTASASTVIADTLKGLDSADLVAPDAPTGTTNSIKCQTLTIDGEDFFEYLGQGGANCTTIGPCDKYSLKYKNEKDGVIKSIGARSVAAGPIEGGGDGGSGPVEDGPSFVYMQGMSTSNCPTTRTLAIDQRDNHTYWIKKMPDGKCWMLTNLAYEGGVGSGVTYSGPDVATQGDGYGGTLGLGLLREPTSNERALYYLTTYAGNVYTTYPDEPSTATDGGANTSTRQYGYMYNQCAARGGTTSPVCPDGINTTTGSAICPADWRLPKGGSSSNEYSALLSSLGATSGAAASNTLKSSFLLQFAGLKSINFESQGDAAYLWTATTSEINIGDLLVVDDFSPFSPVSVPNDLGASVRCLAAT